MPIKWEPLDSSIQEENITLVIGKNILLKIIENVEKQTLLKNKFVDRFIHIPNLCHNDIKSLMDALIREDEELQWYLNISNIFRDKKLASVFLNRKLSKHTSKDIKNEKNDLNILLNSNLIINLMESIFLSGVSYDESIRKQGRKIVSIGGKLKEKTNLDVLEPLNILLCPKCKVVLSIGEFIGSKKCPICKKEIKREEATRIYVHRVHEKIKKIWKENLWFEAYMAKLLRKLEYKTWTSVHVMGASGILHEVDVLAIKNGIVLVCECKTGKVSRNDVFNFCTKTNDLKAHVSVLALIKKLPDPETKEFLKKNPAIITIENMGNKKEDEILTFLENRLSIKG